MFFLFKQNSILFLQKEREFVVKSRFKNNKPLLAVSVMFFKRISITEKNKKKKIQIQKRVFAVYKVSKGLYTLS